MDDAISLSTLLEQVFVFERYGEEKLAGRYARAIIAGLMPSSEATIATALDGVTPA